MQTSDYSAQLGRAAGAVLNATVKSGTNSLHGDAWEFFRNDKLDAADWFEDNSTTPHKGELRLNQFGATIGGPVIKNKFFFFGDYQGTRRVQGTSGSAPVPTQAEQSSNFQNLQDVLTLNAGAAKTDILGRSIQRGTVLDPGTTRFVANGAVDPVSSLTNSSGSDGYVRDPFSSLCGPGTKTFTLAACSDLNKLPVARLDQNAVKLLQLYPAANAGAPVLDIYQASPALFEHANQFDTREDFNPNDANQIFARFSYSDDPQFIPGPFKGVADGGAFQQGVQTAKSAQMVAAYTHVFSPNVVNQARAGFAHLHTTRAGPVATQMGIPAQYGIQGIPQFANNGGLTQIVTTGLQTLGSNQYLPSDEATATIQVQDDFTRIYGKHSFKIGLEFQNAKFSTLQPVASHGTFQYSGTYTDVPNQGTVNGIAQFLLTPIAAPATINGNPNPNGYSYSGGSQSVTASNINKTYDEKKYLALYLQDDWKMTSKMTLNLGVRWDYFGPINETNGGQANFVPTGLPAYGLGSPTFIVPASGKDNRTLSTNGTCSGTGCYGMVDLLAADGITLDVTNKYGDGVLQTQKTNFSPRLGLSYQIARKLVGRGGFGVFYNSFENQGYGPNIGENYPFVFNFGYGVNANTLRPAFGHCFAGCAGQLQHRILGLLHGWTRRHRGRRVRLLVYTIHARRCERQGRGTAGAAVQLPDADFLWRKPFLPVLRHAFAGVDGCVCVHTRQQPAARHGLPQCDPDSACRYHHWRRMHLRNLLRRNYSDEAKLLPIPGFRRRKLPGEHRRKFVSRLANHPSATICQWPDLPVHLHLVQRRCRMPAIC